MMGNNGNPVQRYSKPIPALTHAVHTPQTTDNFRGPKLGLQWQWSANHCTHWYSLSARPGWLRLYPQIAQPMLDEQPNLLLQKLPAQSFCLETELEFSPNQWSEEAGLVLMGQSYVALGLRCKGTRRAILLRTNDSLKIVGETSSSKVRFRLKMKRGGLCFFEVDVGGHSLALSEKFRATKGVWVGAKIGLYVRKPLQTSPGGHADFACFKFSPFDADQVEAAENQKIERPGWTDSRKNKSAS
jgi:beta-xylosidase